MLSDEEKKEIEAEIGIYAQRSAGVTEALKIVQKHRGWISDEALKDIGAFLRLTPDEVDSVATFYSLIWRRPVGRHVILLCDSVSCWVMGYSGVREYLSSKLGVALGQTTPDRRFTLLPCACLGLCEQAPAMLVDYEVHGHLTPDRIDAILEQYA